MYINLGSFCVVVWLYTVTGVKRRYLKSKTEYLWQAIWVQERAKLSAKGLGEKQPFFEKMNIWKRQLLQLLRAYLPALCAGLESIYRDRFVERKQKQMGLLLLGSLCTNRTTGCVLSLARGSDGCCQTPTQTPAPVSVRRETPLWDKGLWENVWHFIGIPSAGIKRILIVESCGLFSIKPPRESEFWGGWWKKAFWRKFRNKLSKFTLLS